MENQRPSVTVEGTVATVRVLAVVTCSDKMSLATPRRIDEDEAETRVKRLSRRHLVLMLP